MLKLLIADDERIIRETISSIINWRDYDIEVIGLCQNGIQAYDMILDESPDIVLTDIRMPGMDGLELIRRVSQTDLHTQFIILSGFGEFEYAKEAMRCGVRHYLLKPCNETQIIECVQECRKDLERAVTVRYMQDRQFTLYKEMFHSVISGIMNDCLHASDAPELLASHYDRYIDYEFTAYRLYYVYYLEADRLQDYLRMLHGFLAEAMPQAVVYEIYVTNTLLLFLQNPGDAASELTEFLQRNVQIGQTVSLEIEEAYYSSLGQLLRVIVGRLRRFTRIYFINDGQVTPTFNYYGAMARMQEIYEAYDDSDAGRLAAAQAVLEEIDGSDQLRQLASGLFLKMVSGSNSFSTFNLAEWLVQMEGETDPAALRAMILEHFTRLARDRQASHQHSPMVRQIHSYVAAHLQESSLTLKQIAETELFMNVDYVSKRFYKETGRKFSQYLTDLRISRAKELLAQNPDEPIKNIAEQVGCGNNPQYFSQLFKKQTHMTPTEYVQSL